ncbi:MAG: SMC family ATPase [Chloroflexi bacterium]|nr:SMC family ATPase [Chloroflexota bacterium]
MIPVSLTLKGFLSYQQETSVDLTPVEVACVSGSNGAGKSTLFDAITWALFGRARRSDDALINDACEACSVSFTFDYESNRYRVLREKPRGKGATLEFQIKNTDGTWKPLTEAGLRATEDRIRDVLRLDYDTFINASFFLQGKADIFTQQAPARRKEILSNILGLEVWETYREEAANRRRADSEEAKAQRALLAEVEEELGEEEERKERLNLLLGNLKTTSALREEKERYFGQSQVQAQVLKAETEKLALMLQNLEAGRKRLADIRSRMSTVTGELDSLEMILTQETRIEKDYSQWSSLRSELERWNDLFQRSQELVTQRAELESIVRAEAARLEQEAQGLKSQKTVIEDEQPRLAVMQVELEDLANQQESINKRIAELSELEKLLADAQKSQGELAAVNKSLREGMKDLDARMKELQASSGGDCPLCGQVLTDQHKNEILAQYQAEGSQLGNRYRDNEKASKELTVKMGDLTAKINELRKLSEESVALNRKSAGLSAQTDSLQVRHSQWQQEGALRLAELETILSHLSFSTAERSQLALLEEKIKELGYDEAAHAKARQEESVLRTVEADYLALGKARASTTGLRSELTSLEENKNILEDEIKSQTLVVESMRRDLSQKEEGLPDMDVLRRELDEIRLSENKLRAEVGGAEQIVNVLEARRKQKKELNGKIEAINRGVTQLRMLETAFGKDGVPALLIEQALPEIETQANEILDRLSDGRMSVSFETERQFKDKKREDKKQTLDILISDAFGRREYELFSGGEAFRINFAIRLALSRVLAGRAGARLQTLVIDEGFGSQDADGIQRLIEAIHLVSRDFAKILVITHLDELKDAFPSRIEVTKTDGGSRVEVIA